MIKRIPVVLGGIQTFVAIGAVPAGLSMVTKRDGSGLGISTELLHSSPFRDFLIPGLFLLLVLGLLNIMGAVLSFKRNKYTGVLGLGLGFILVIWICVQVYFIGLQSILQYLFFFLGLFEMVVGYIYIPKKIGEANAGKNKFPQYH
jgi:hypothetical protein